MKAIAIGKRLIERGVEHATEIVFDVFHAVNSEATKSIRLYEAEEAYILLDEAELDVFLFVDLEHLKLFTAEDPRSSPEILRPFLRGCLRAARSIWGFEKNPKLDFDFGDFFYRRPWFGRGDLLDFQTVVFSAHTCSEETTITRKDLILFAFGRSQEGLPPVEEVPQHLEDVHNVYHQLAERLTTPDWVSLEKSRKAVADTRVFSLPDNPQPALLSYDQWLRKLHGTVQHEFITKEISHPLRIDGPAGSGKTLSLVLKCLYTLKSAREKNHPHHAAFVVFSEETKRRIVESFFVPLDGDGFYLADRADSQHSVTITTLLDWSRKDLKEVADPYELSAEDPAVARRDQSDIIRDLLAEKIPSLLASIGHTLSPELRTLLSKSKPVVVTMLQHEFGVVIKGMSDGDMLRYLEVQRPAIGLPCRTELDRRFVYTLFQVYQATLEEYGIVDLDDVAISHIKLLQMPLRRRTREKHAFDSVFVDEAHSFNPNELGVFFLLTRQAALPPLVIAVDIPQGVGDKGYEGGGIEDYILHEADPHLRERVMRFTFGESFRCAPGILDLAASVFVQGHDFFKPIRLPGALKSSHREEAGRKPYAHRFSSRVEMMNAVLPVAIRLADQLSCRRSNVLIVLLNKELFDVIPDRLSAHAKILQARVDVAQERKAQKSNHFVVGRPEYLHGLEYEGVVVVGVTEGEFPPINEAAQGGGASAVFATQQAVDLLYLSITRARQQVVLLYDKRPSFLIDKAIKDGAVEDKGEFKE